MLSTNSNTTSDRLPLHDNPPEACLSEAITNMCSSSCSTRIVYVASCCLATILHAVIDHATAMEVLASAACHVLPVENLGPRPLCSSGLCKRIAAAPLCFPSDSFRFDRSFIPIWMSCFFVFVKTSLLRARVGTVAYAPPAPSGGLTQPPHPREPPSGRAAARPSS